MDDSTPFATRYGPVALVAGAAVGLGAAWADALAARGLDLVLIDRDAAPLARTADAMRAAHRVTIDTATLDLGRPDLLAALAPVVDGRAIGLVVCNAALGTVAPFLDLAPEHLDAMLAVNCRGPLLLAHAFAPGMVARGRGGIVVMSSLSANVGSAQLSVYAASKAFDLVFADALWAELRPHGVDVLAVQPGSTRTPDWLSSQPADAAGAGVPVMEPAAVVAEALDALGREPLLVPGEMNRQGAALLAGMPRRQAILLLSGITGGLVPNYRRP
ncbi:MAG: SDR family NAD(P)-dependent oxidoreductase [bacterium]|nr:SDR family NAD(P)-dependent oxidoreductase [bacterium]